MVTAVQHVKAGPKQSISQDGKLPHPPTPTTRYTQISLYAVDSVLNVVRSINNAFRRQDQIEYLESGNGFEFAPIIADAEADRRSSKCV